MKGNSIKDCDFFKVLNFCEVLLMSLVARGAKKASYATGHHYLNFNNGIVFPFKIFPYETYHTH
jgi:hypothetical protein